MKISIITPTLNQGRFIEETIRSIITQEGDFELEYIIAVDGNPVDNTVEIVKKFDRLISSGRFKPRCRKLTYRWFQQENKGQSNAINNGFRKVKGEIINWICSDDILEQGALATINKYFEKNKDKNIVFGDAYNIDEKGKINGSLKGREFSRDELIDRWNKAYHKFFIIQPSVFFRKRLLKTYGYLREDIRYCMDYELWLRFNKCEKFNHIGEILSRNREHNDSKSTRYKWEQFEESIRCSREYWGENIKYPISYQLYKYVKYPIWKVLRLLTSSS